MVVEMPVDSKEQLFLSRNINCFDIDSSMMTEGKLLLRKNINSQDIEKCIVGNEWDFGNQILYDMCRQNPEHNDTQIIIGKMWLIGRAYAAAIERRKTDKDANYSNDFYFRDVAPIMLRVGAEVDNRIMQLKECDSINVDNLEMIVDTHLYLTDIFSKMTGLNKRSLASKYLHFHVPNMFYIYDSRAIQAARKLILPNKEIRASLATLGDKDYIELVIRLFTLQEYIYNQYGLEMSPRAIDSFLLKY